MLLLDRAELLGKGCSFFLGGWRVGGKCFSRQALQNCQLASIVTSPHGIRPAWVLWLETGPEPLTVRYSKQWRLVVNDLLTHTLMRYRSFGGCCSDACDPNTCNSQHCHEVLDRCHHPAHSQLVALPSAAPSPVVADDVRSDSARVACTAFFHIFKSLPRL